jgi:hypothetical protein
MVSTLKGNRPRLAPSVDWRDPVIVAAAVCPHPPLLLDELGGRHDSVEQLRLACRRAIDDLLGHGLDGIVVVGGAESTRTAVPADRLNLRAYGTLAAPVAPLENGVGLPLSLGVADRLLAEAEWCGETERRAIAWNAGAEECDHLGRELVRRGGRLGLLVMGDGSACRGTKAPGHYDDRAHSFDERVAHALEQGDCHALRGLDPEQAEQLLMQGRTALQVLGSAVHHTGATPAATMHYLDDPFGVLYFVSSWSIMPSRRA